jgi:ribosomal protein L18
VHRALTGCARALQTNRDVIAQIFAADLTHDVCIAAAYSHELTRYGITLGLTNYAAAYATGLLLARRVNKKFNLDYEGNTEVDGNDYNVEHNEDGKAPFKALLDVGLARTTTGARIFGALKGACTSRCWLVALGFSQEPTRPLQVPAMVALRCPTRTAASRARSAVRARSGSRTPRFTASTSSVATSPTTCAR